MSVRVLWVGLYGLLMACFFAIGVYFPSLVGVCFIVLPLILSIILGYLSRSVEEAFKVQILGLVVFGLLSLVILYILSNSLTNSLYWVYAESWPELSEALIHGEAFEIIIGVLATTLLGFFVTQIPLTISGVIIGLFGKEFDRVIWPSRRRTKTYGDFTGEGVTKTGVSKIRIIGTVPEELVEWMKKEIEAGNYVTQSHIMEAALRKLQEVDTKKTE